MTFYPADTQNHGFGQAQYLRYPCFTLIALMAFQLPHGLLL